MHIGVDLIENRRIAKSIDRFGDRFLKRIYTEGERAYCKQRISSLAARWAAKEAVAKALGTGIGDVSWQEIEIIDQPHGPPLVQLHGQAKTLAKTLGLLGFAISLSHTKNYAVAFAVGQPFTPAA